MDLGKLILEKALLDVSNMSLEDYEILFNKSKEREKIYLGNMSLETKISIVNSFKPVNENKFTNINKQLSNTLSETDNKYQFNDSLYMAIAA